MLLFILPQLKRECEKILRIFSPYHRSYSLFAQNAFTRKRARILPNSLHSRF